MICLDTNYLIRGVAEDTAEAAKLVAWLKAGETLITAMPAWFEFLCGPVTDDHVATMRAFLAEIIPFAEAEAVEAARLFNAAQRKRPLRVDAMIAGTAIAANASLATNNRADYRPFVAHGLKLA
ncbi:MAG: PIN domain-containing protein [Chthoniobacteraceae bacterium]